MMINVQWIELPLAIVGGITLLVLLLLGIGQIHGIAMVLT